MVSVIDTLRIPFQDVKALAVGVIIPAIVIFSFIFIPTENVMLGAILMFLLSLLFMGYGMQVLKDPERPARWVPFKPILVDSVLSTLLIWIYLIIPMILTMMVDLDVLNLFMVKLPALEPAAILVTMIIAIVAYIVPSVLMHYAHEGFKAAFDMKEILTKAFSLTYAGAILFAMILQAILSGISFAAIDVGTASVPAYAVYSVLYGLLMFLSTVWIFAIIGQSWEEF